MVTEELTPKQLFLSGGSETVKDWALFGRFLEDYLTSEPSDEHPRFLTQRYWFHKDVAYVGNCALMRMAFTVALIVTIDPDLLAWERRYCYESVKDAYEALKEWNGIGHPGGNWIKCKGDGRDFTNPNNTTEWLHQEKS